MAPIATKLQAKVADGRNLPAWCLRTHLWREYIVEPRSSHMITAEMWGWTIGGVLTAIAVVKAGAFLFRPMPWDYVTILCARGWRRPGRRRYHQIILGTKATVMEDVDDSGRTLRVEIVVPRWTHRELDQLANLPDAVQKKPWSFENGTYIIDCSHLHGKRPATRDIRTWAEPLARSGIRFVAERG